MWNMIKVLIGFGKMNKGISQLQLDGKVVENVIEIVEQFNLYFFLIVVNLRFRFGNILLDLFKLVNFVEFCKDLDVVFFVLDIIDVQVFQIIKGISFYKVVGIDKISVRFLCIVVFILVLSIVRFINMLFFIGKFFICWKIVNVILLFK